MSSDYELLLSATIEHLKLLKGRGQSFVSVKQATLEALRQAPPPRVGVSYFSSPEPVPRKSSQSTEVSSVETAAMANAVVPAPSAKLSVPVPSAPVTAEPATMPLSKEQRLEQLRREVLACVKCPHLVAARKNVVFGVGDINARLMFVGEAPGADEDAQGEPFVGKAGQTLTRMIKAMGLSRETVYIANILKCRPDTPGKKYGNRKPTAEEMRICIPWLEKQIELVGPEVLVALGGTALEGLLGHPVGIMRLRGQWQSYRNIPVMPTFHPSYLLHFEGNQPEEAVLAEKRKVWEDMLQVMAKLGMPISDKQRNFFLKAS